MEEPNREDPDEVEAELAQVVTRLEEMGDMKPEYRAVVDLLIEGGLLFKDPPDPEDPEVEAWKREVYEVFAGLVESIDALVADEIELTQDPEKLQAIEGLRGANEGMRGTIGRFAPKPADLEALTRSMLEFALRRSRPPANLGD